MTDLKPGQLVRSLAGRDKGRHYLVLCELDSKNVLLIDGRSRPVSRPKKKNKAHLQYYERRAELGEPHQVEKLIDSQVVKLLKDLTPASGFSEEEV